MDINVIQIIKSTLNYVDPRLIGHGSSVACFTYNIIKDLPQFKQEQFSSICLAAFLHDIGAYETEDIDQLLQFETETVWAHSIYGYLILKNFSPLQEFAPSVLYHHASLKDISSATPLQQEVAQIIQISDRMDIAKHSGNGEADVRRIIEKGRGRAYSEKIADYLLAGDRLGRLFEACPNDDFNEILYDKNWTEEDLFNLIRLIVLSIDFRSPQTVSHTIGVTCTSAEIGRLMNYGEDELEDLKLGAWLHDIGKVGVPVGILENPGRLDDRQYEIMRNHIVITDEILTGNVDDKIRYISARHHEKLDGTGYPHGLRGEELSTSQRIVAVADIFSALSGERTYKDAYPKEKVVAVLEGMGERNHLDSDIVKIVVDNYEDMLDKIDFALNPISAQYKEMQNEFISLSNQFS